MAERKTKRNTRSLRARKGFQISRKPIVRLAADDRLQNVVDSAGLPRVYGPPIVFAIARDSRTIFVSWNIDWLSVFEKAMPVDREVHLRVYRAAGLEEKSAAVEPMVGIHYVKKLQLRGEPLMRPIAKSSRGAPACSLHSVRPAPRADSKATGPRLGRKRLP